MIIVAVLKYGPRNGKIFKMKLSIVKANFVIMFSGLLNISPEITPSGTDNNCS